MVLFEECFAEFYDSLRINFLYSQIMMESENSSESIFKNIKEFFVNIIKFIKKLGEEIKEGFLKFHENEKKLDSIVESAMKKIKSDPELKAKHVDYFDYAKYQKNIDGFMKEVTTKFDKLISLEAKYTYDEDRLQPLFNQFNKDVEELYKKYDLDDEDKFKVNGSLAEAIQKTYSEQKKSEKLSDYQIRNWNACIANMQEKVDSLSNKNNSSEITVSKFDKIKSGITKFNGYMGKAIKKVATSIPKDVYKLAGAIGVSAAMYYGPRVINNQYAKHQQRKKDKEDRVVYTTLAN